MDDLQFEVCIFEWRGTNGSWATDPQPRNILDIGLPIVVAYRFKNVLYVKTTDLDAKDSVWFRYNPDYCTWYRMLCAPWGEHPVPNCAAELLNQ